MSLFASRLRYIYYNQEMKTAVLEFQRNRVRRQPSGAAASIDILKTISQLRSALQRIGRAIEAVERQAFAQSGAAPPKPASRPASPRKRASKAKREIKVIALPLAPQPPEASSSLESTPGS